MSDHTVNGNVCGSLAMSSANFENYMMAVGSGGEFGDFNFDPLTTMWSESFAANGGVTAWAGIGEGDDLSAIIGLTGAT